VSRTDAPRALLLTGPVGSGKTSALAAAAGLVGERCAAIDLDWLTWADVPGATVDELLEANLRAVWQTFRGAGVTRLLLARRLPSREALAPVERALAGVELATVRLVLPHAELERRLRARDEHELEAHLGLVAEDEGAEVFEDACVEAAGLTPAQVAAAALAAAGWR
jgi:adenylylsulfate kinase